MQLCSIRSAKPEEQRELTRLCVRATMHAGYDDAFIDRVMPGLTITLPLINGGCVQVAEEKPGVVVGVVAVTTLAQGIALLNSMFVDPAFWRQGVGRALFRAAVARARTLKTGASMIYAEPSAEGFYKRMGAIRIGEGPFFYSQKSYCPSFFTSFHGRHEGDPFNSACRDRDRLAPNLVHRRGRGVLVDPWGGADLLLSCHLLQRRRLERVNITTIRSRGGEDDVGQLQARCEYAILTEVSGNILPCLIIRLPNHFQGFRSECRSVNELAGSVTRPDSGSRGIAARATFSASPSRPQSAAGQELR